MLSDLDRLDLTAGHPCQLSKSGAELMKLRSKARFHQHAPNHMPKNQRFRVHWSRQHVQHALAFCFLLPLTDRCDAGELCCVSPSWQQASSLVSFAAMHQRPFPHSHSSLKHCLGSFICIPAAEPQTAWPTCLKAHWHMAPSQASIN